VDSLSEHDQRRLEQLHAVIREDQDILLEINRRQVVENRPLDRRRLLLEAEQVRETYNQHREEYDDLLRKEIPTRFAPSEQALIHMVVQRLTSDELDLTRKALQEADRDPNTPEFTQLVAAVVAALPDVQQQLVAENMAAANHLAQVAPVIQAPIADIKQKLKLSIPLIPFLLSFETELNLNIAANLTAAWERLKERLHPQ
jgi:hypothetical protein